MQKSQSSGRDWRALADELNGETVRERESELVTCASCRGTGRNPLSDTVNWLPCDTCAGAGVRPRPLRARRS
jgi:hypothetical protein